MSVWQIRKLGPRGLAVPLSCCVQDIYTMSYLSPQPLNATRCQEVKPNGQFRYVQVITPYGLYVFGVGTFPPPSLPLSPRV